MDLDPQMRLRRAFGAGALVLGTLAAASGFSGEAAAGAGVPAASSGPETTPSTFTIDDPKLQGTAPANRGEETPAQPAQVPVSEASTVPESEVRPALSTQAVPVPGLQTASTEAVPATGARSVLHPQAVPAKDITFVG